MDGVPADGRGDREVSEKKLKLRERAHGESAHSLHFHRHGEEARAAFGNGGESAHVLHDGYAGTEQGGMNGARSVVGRIDVERIDPDESHTGFDELFGEFARQMR